MKLGEAYEVLAKHWTDQLIVAGLGSSSWEWQNLHRDSDKVWFHQPTMGMTGSMGLGLAANLPQAKVWVFEGDGGFLMGFTSLLPLAEHQPPNLVQFVASNRAYRTIGGYPLPNQKNSDYVATAKGLGIKNAYSFDDLEAFRKEIPGILSANEFAMVFLEVDHSMAAKHPLGTEGAEQKFRFGRYIERKFGVEVFGPSGF